MPQYVESRDPHEDMNMSAFFSSALSDVQATPKGSFTERCAEVGGGGGILSHIRGDSAIRAF